MKSIYNDLNYIDNKTIILKLMTIKSDIDNIIKDKNYNYDHNLQKISNLLDQTLKDFGV